MQNLQSQNLLAAVRESSASVTVTEYQMVNDRTARVMATVTGRPSRDRMFQDMSAVLKDGTPVRSSFRWLEENKYMVGFVTSNPEVRVLGNDQDIKASYNLVARNMYIDKSDESLWELRESQSGKFLSRRGSDNLSELLEASRSTPSGSTPRMYSVVQAAVRRHEVLAFVSTDSNVVEVDHGFCVDVGERNGERAYRVVSFTNNQPVSVQASAVVGAYAVAEPMKVEGAQLVKAADVGTQIEYYRKAYPYNQEYIEKIIKQINEMSSL